METQRTEYLIWWVGIELVAYGILPVVERMHDTAAREDQFAWACTVCHSHPEMEVVVPHALSEDDENDGVDVVVDDDDTRGEVEHTLVSRGTVPVRAIVHVQTRSWSNGTGEVEVPVAAFLHDEDDDIRVAAEVLSVVFDNYEQSEEEGLDEKDT